MWSRGYFVRSVGSVTTETISRYVATQFAHHELRPDVFTPVGCVGDVTQINTLRKSAHGVFELNCHFVFAVARREFFFDSAVARGLLMRMQSDADRAGVVVWRLEVLPDHVHLLAGLQPRHAPAEVAGALMGGAWEWLHERHSSALRSERIENVWKLSYYAGTAGAATTAQVKSSLRKWEIDV